MKTTRKSETNVAFVKRIMETGSPLRQAFVIEAIHRYADECFAAKPEDFDSQLLSGRAWHDMAREIKNECDDKYGRRFRK